MKKLAAAVILLAACSSGGNGAEDTVPPPHTLIAYLTPERNVEVLEPTSGTVQAITTDAGNTRRYTQPTWAPDGTRLAFVRLGPAPSDGPIQADPGRFVRAGLEAQASDPSAVHIASVETGEVSVIETPFAAFYLYWSPDGQKIAMLGNDLEFGRQGLLLVDVVAGSVRRLDSGQPYYFAWSPDSDRLLVHAEDRALYYLELDGSTTPLDQQPGTFTAPHWVGDSQLYPVFEGDEQALNVFTVDGRVERRSATPPAAVVFVLNPDGRRVAHLPIADGVVDPFRLGPLFVEDGGRTTQVATEAAAFFWSPAGERLLYLTGSLGGPVRWNLWDGEETTPFEAFTPTGTFIQQYFPFFGQYANSLTFLSPDGQSFTFAGTIEGRGEGIWVQDVAAGARARKVADGVFSTWSPPLGGVLER